MVQTPTSTSQDSTVTPPQGQGQQGDTMRQQSQLLSLSSSSSSTPVLLGLTDLQGNLDPGAEVSSAQQGAGSGQGQGQGGILVAADAGQSVLMISGGGGEGRRQLQQPPEATPPQEQELSLQVSFYLLFIAFTTFVSPGDFCPKFAHYCVRFKNTAVSSADAESKVPSVEIPDLLKVLPLKHGVGQNIVMHSLPILVISSFPTANFRDPRFVKRSSFKAWSRSEYSNA